MAEVSCHAPRRHLPNCFRRSWPSRVSNCQGEGLNVRVTNAGKASYPDAWKGYNVCASYDRKHWFRWAPLHMLLLCILLLLLYVHACLGSSLWG